MGAPRPSTIRPVEDALAPALSDHSRFRPEIQGLRAVAVALVVVFHLWPDTLPGGFIGVDVFFVISGYLITSLIARELLSTGRISLREFWARRVRRLLPASLLVLLVCALATVAILPATLWSMTAEQIAASALYVQNWELARQSVDYLAIDNVPTLVQHYWSLSVEEQFYLAWPVVLLGIVGAATLVRAPRLDPRRSLLTGMALFGAASLVWSIWSTNRSPSTAYFVTTTRTWEFVVGGMLSLVAVERTMSPKVATGLAWGGLAAIVVSAVALDTDSAFPGWVALIPVTGACAVIWGARPHGGRGRSSVLSARPMTRIGDLSYSIYLWHWPLIVLAPYVTRATLTTVDKGAIVALTVLLAWGTKTYVEDPLRSGPLLSVRPRRALAFAATGMALVLVSTNGIERHVEQKAVAATAALSLTSSTIGSERPCVGPAALDPGSRCPPTGVGSLSEPPEVVAQENSDPPFYRGCHQDETHEEVLTCVLGSRTEPVERTVAVVGDSHAAHWFPTLDRMGRERGWRVLTFTKSSCPITAARRVVSSERTSASSESCLRWSSAVREAVARNPRISYVFTSAYSSAYEFVSDGSTPLKNPGPDGFKAAWSTWERAGKSVFVIGDVPQTIGTNVPTCLAVSNSDAMACATRRASQPSDLLLSTAAATAGVTAIDLSDRFCDATWCYPVVGGTIVYRDYSHLSREYALALTPYLSSAIDLAAL